MSNQLAVLEKGILATRSTFDSVLADPGLKFEAEAGFALQALQNNDYLSRVAFGNQPALIAAVTNVAAIGISLNPAKKQAYLVPRKNKVCLDISYMGLLHLAMQTGAIQWGQARIARLNDDFELLGIDVAPHHKYDPFAPEEERGPIVGAYVVVKTDGGDYLTHPMPIAEIYAIRDRSEAWKAWVAKKMACPWHTDEGEMIKKTVVKQASKYWPHRDRLQQAIHYVDTEGGEGIDFDNPKDVTPSTEQQQERLAELLVAYGRSWEALSAVYPKGTPYKDRPMSEVAADDMDTMIRFLEKKIDDAKNKQPAAA
jgi:recombination protein RecT